MPIIAAMTDAEALARRYFALWAEYLTALVADPQAAEMLRRWIAFTSQFASQFPGAANERRSAPHPGCPPIPGVFGPGSVGPPSPTAPVAGASGERGDAVGELA